MSNIITLPTNWNNKDKFSFDQIVAETTRQHAFKEDFCAVPQTMYINNDGKLVIDKVPYSLSSWALNQLCVRLKANYTYIAKCPPYLQSKNLNYWLKRVPEEDTKWLMRSMNVDGSRTIRGIMSEVYSEFDNIEIIDIMQKVLEGTDGEIVLWHQDEANGGFHLRVAFPNLTTQVGTLPDGSPDLLQVGIHFSNSEVGKRSITVAPLVYRLVCTNGLMRWDVEGEVFKQRHIHLNRDEIYGKVADATAKALGQGDDLIRKFAESKKVLIGNPMEVIERLTGHNNSFYFSKKTIELIKTNYALEKTGDEDTLFDLVNSLTRTAQSLDADRRVTLERFAHKLMIA